MYSHGNISLRMGPLLAHSKSIRIKFQKSLLGVKPPVASIPHGCTPPLQHAAIPPKRALASTPPLAGHHSRYTPPWLVPARLAGYKKLPKQLQLWVVFLMCMGSAVVHLVVFVWRSTSRRGCATKPKPPSSPLEQLIPYEVRCTGVSAATKYCLQDWLPPPSWTEYLSAWAPAGQLPTPSTWTVPSISLAAATPLSKKISPSHLFLFLVKEALSKLTESTTSLMRRQSPPASLLLVLPPSGYICRHSLPEPRPGDVFPPRLCFFVLVFFQEANWFMPWLCFLDVTPSCVYTILGILVDGNNNLVVPAGLACAGRFV